MKVVEGIGEATTLRVDLDDCDRDETAFFPITTKLRRNGFVVLYYGHDSRLRDKHPEFMRGLTDSYVVTKRASDPEEGKLECWVLPITAQDWLLRFQKHEPLVLPPGAHVTLWGLPVEPNEFPTAMYINQGCATDQVSVAGGVVLSRFSPWEVEEKPDGAKQAPENVVNVFSDDDKVAELEAKVEELDNELNLAEGTSCAMFDDLQEARRKLSDKTARYQDLEKTFHKLRKQSLNRAQTIIEMVNLAEIREKEVSQLRGCKSVMLTQNAEIRGLTDELERAHSAIGLVNEANERLNKRLDVARQGGKQDYEVDATKVIALSSFKMSTVATAIRWLSTAATIGSVAYLLVG